MEIIRAIIIEDEPEAQAMLQALLEKYCPNVQLLGAASNVQEGVALIKATQPDLVFLDIEMPGEKGLFLFQYFEQVDFEVIFTTAYDEYAINAIRLSALDYLLKPIGLEELQTALQQFQKKRSNQQLHTALYQQLTQQANLPKRLALPSKNSFVFLEVEQIMYCQADGSYSTFVTCGGKKHLVAKPLKEYADLLENLGFVRVHRSAIINLHYVDELIRTRPQSVVMKDQQRLPLAQSRKDHLMTKLMGV